MNASMHLNNETVVVNHLTESTKDQASIEYRAWLVVRNFIWGADQKGHSESIDLWFDTVESIDNLLSGLQQLKAKIEKEQNKQDDLIDAIESIASVC